jgi:NTP pyrophosphatase (non-canonical NTP hydrolase)
MTMTPNEYQQLALKTESVRHIFDPQVFGHAGARDLSRVLHAMIGLATESGESLDAMKKHLFYGKPLDLVNVAEEFQDLVWYIAVGLDACGMTLEEAMERNIAKLKARYGEKFSPDRALNRDLATERKILEGEPNP